MVMAPCLKLPKNFHVRTFGSTRNSNGVGKYLMPPPQFDSPLIDPIPSVAHADRVEELTHVSETRLSESLSRPAPRNCPTSEPTVGSEERPDPDSEISSGGGKAARKRKATAAPKRKRTAPKTVNRRWQEV
jgi:hypothetical protein